MSDDQYIKMFRYMTERFDALERRMDEKADKADMNRILNSIDGIIARMDTDEKERSAILHQLGRHERWIERLSANTGTKLSYQ